MKKTFSLFVAFLLLSSSSLYALGADAFPVINTDNNLNANANNWKVAFKLYARTVGSIGQGLDKAQLSEHHVGNGGSMRIRPEVIATNGNFVFGFGLGTDIYFGSVNPLPGGSNKVGYGMSGNGTNLLQLRDLYIGYQWDSGMYTSWGIQDASVPYFNADPAAGVVAGWKNTDSDITAFYFQLMEGDVYNVKDNGGLFGVKANIKPNNSFYITPFLMGLWQGKDVGMTDTTADDPIQPIDSASGYDGGAHFVGGVGMFAGLEMGYTAPFGLYINLDAIYAYGKNKALKNGEGSGRYNQTRNAFGGLLSVGYTLPEIVKAELFLDMRTGSKNVDKDGTNASINGALIEYDAKTPPLLLMYNAGLGREHFQFTANFNDGYAFTDRGAMTIGADANFTLGVFDIGTALGYAWYTAPRSGNKSNIGFEFDLTAAYNIMDGLKMGIEGGLLAPGKGAKQEHESELGSTFKSQMPWTANIYLKYDL